MDKFGKSNNGCNTNTKLRLDDFFSPIKHILMKSTYNTPMLNINSRLSFVLKMTWSLCNHVTGSKRTVKSSAILIAADAYACVPTSKHVPLLSPLQPFQLYDIGIH